jgi:hypothetical protein
MDATTPSTEPHIRKGDTVTVSDDVTTVTYGKIFTPAGERLEIEAPNVGFRIRLDAMELETLAWQGHETFRSFVETAGDRVPGDIEDRLEAMDGYDGEASFDPEEASETLGVTNEFAEAHIQHQRVDGDDRVQITAPKLGYQVVLTPTELESVTWQDTKTFTDFLETPFGPGGHH